MSQTKQKMAIRMAIYTAIIALVVASIASVVSIRIVLNNLLTVQNATLSSIQTSTLPAFNLATFDYNLNLIQELADGLTSHPDIASVFIIDHTGFKLAGSEHRQTCSYNRLELLLFPANDIAITTLSYNSIGLGKLILEADRCTLLVNVHAMIKTALLYSLSFSIILAILIFLAFYFTVTHPLTAFTKRIANINPHYLELEDLTKLKSNRPDEIGTLMECFVSLLELLKQDIERQKQHETTISDYSNKLEKLIHKRTSAFTSINRRLQKSEERLKNPSALQSRLNTLMHLLNSPLQELVSYLNQQQQDDARTVAEQLQQLVSDLLIIQELSSDTPFSLTNINTLATICINQTHEHRDNINIICDMQDEIFIINDCVKLLISCLLSNAIYYNGKRSLLLHIYPDGKNLVISISGKDLNIEVNDQNQDLLPLNPKSLHLPSSIGLGLLKELCNLMGGRFTIEQFELQGQTISCQLPLLSRQQILQRVQNHFKNHPIALQINDENWLNFVQTLLIRWHIPHQLTAPTSEQVLITDSNHHDHIPELTINGLNSLDGWPDESECLQALLKLADRQNRLSHPRVNILLVDDNTINRMLSQRYLKNLHIVPDIADNGLQAVEKAQRKRYDLILMDCQMPVMDGFEATRKIRRSSLNQDTPIIALTGLSGEQERQNCLAVGMNDFIGKPFTQDQIQAALMQWIARYGHLDDF